MTIYGSSGPIYGSSAAFAALWPWWQDVLTPPAETWTIDEHCCWERPRPSINQVHPMDTQIGQHRWVTLQGRVIGPARIMAITSGFAGELYDTSGRVVLTWTGTGYVGRLSITVPAGETFCTSCFSFITYEVDDVATLQFGKHAGKEMADVPADYLDWLKREAEARIKEVDVELTRRAALASPASPLIDQIVAAGYRALAKTAHPDGGGSATEFQSLQQAKAQLDAVLSEIHAAAPATGAGRRSK